MQAPSEEFSARPATRSGFSTLIAAAVAGLGAALIMVAVSLVVRQLTNVPTLTEVMADGFTAFVPLSLFSALITVLESYAKRYLFVGIVALQVAIGILIAWGLMGRLGRRVLAGDNVPWRFGAILGVVAWLVVMLAVMPAFGAGFFAQNLRAGTYIALAGLVDWLAFGLSFVWLFWQLAPAPPPVDALGLPLPGAPNPARRRVLVGGGLAVLAGVLGALGLRSFLNAPVYTVARSSGAPAPAPAPEAVPTAAGAAAAPTQVAAAAAPTAVPASASAEPTAAAVSSSINRVTPVTPVAPPESAALEVPGMTLAITPNKDFYTVSKNFLDPTVDIDKWKLEVTGMVDNPLSFTYDEFVRLPTREQFQTLECISNEVGGDLMGCAIWRGVPFKTLLEMAKPKPGVQKVVLRAWDDYSDSFPYERAMNEANLIAFEMNGATLPHDHGFPLRLLVPGIFGMKNVKWITKIELVDNDYKGFWQQRGWSDIATVVTMSRIDVPIRSSFDEREASYVAGVAFAGDRGIQQVEVSLDNGSTWQPAELKKPLGPYTWILWTYTWNGAPGTYNVKVRATDGNGDLQPEEEAPPIPDGAAGWHLRRFKVT